MGRKAAVAELATDKREAAVSRPARLWPYSAIVFMNENLLRPRSKKPKITIQRPDGKRRTAHQVYVEGRIVTGHLDVGTHVLKAWVEADRVRIVR